MLICLEIWAFEVMTLMSGYLDSTAETATQIIMFNIMMFFLAFSLGFNISASALVGKEIGA